MSHSSSNDKTPRSKFKAPYAIDAVDEFIALKAQRMPKTRAAYETLLRGSDRGTKPALGCAFAPYFQGVRMDRIDPPQITEWFAQRCGNGAQPTRSRFSRNSREFLNHCATQGYCRPDLAKAILPEAEGAGRLVWLSWDEVEAILREIVEFRIELAVAWLFHTGCRVSEAVSADQSEVQWDKQRRMYTWSIPKSKTHYPRDVWLPEALNPYIEQSRKDNKPKGSWPMLWDCDGRGFGRVENPIARITEKTINGSLERACHDAGIYKDVTAHVGRHTYCSAWITDHGDGERALKLLAKQVGATVGTLRKTYIHISSTDEEIERIRGFGVGRRK